MKLYKFIVMVLCLLFISSEAIAELKLHFVQSESAKPIASLELLKNELQQKISSEFIMASNNDAQANSIIHMSFGINQLESALEKGKTIDIATLISQSEIIALIKKYPQQLKMTKVVLNGALFQCQLELFKKNNPFDENTLPKLGILLSRDSGHLLKEIESYAKNRQIDVAFMILNHNESVVRSFHYLMLKNQTVMMISDNKIYNQEKLSTILREAELTKTIIITDTVVSPYSESQHCGFTEESTINKVIEITRQTLNKVNPIKSLIPGYQVFAPEAATL